MISQNKALQLNKPRFVWRNFTPQDLERYYNSAQKGNLLQSYPYAVACAKLNHQTIRQGIFYIENQPAALCQILEAGFIKNTVHAAILDRGPLWFKNYGSEEDFALFVQQFRREFPARMGRKIRFIPEIKNTPAIHRIMKHNGFKQAADSKPYKTIWLDLRPDLDTLKKNLDKKWRNALSKSQKQDLKITMNSTPELFSWFLKSYAQDKKDKFYHGASLKLLSNLIYEFSRGKNVLTAYALFDEKPIAAILIFIHGNSATYQIGYTSALGREKCAHNALLWNALTALKGRNVHDFDLGGIIGDKDGITTFKKGMGGKIIETPGLFIG